MSPIEINIPPSKIQTIRQDKIQLDILREDQNHPAIQGNKLRKLKYNLLQAQEENCDTLLTFGGAFSNHIYATAAAGKAFGFKTIGIIRGEELANKPLNFTLKNAQDFGMDLKFVTRQKYRLKDDATYLKNLKEKNPKTYILPEGGTNDPAVKGCEEILNERTNLYDYICVPMGTAGTIAGIIRSSEMTQTVLGFPALKNADFLKKTIQNYTKKTNYEIINAYHFGGYAKFSDELITFVNDFCATTQIPIEPIYTGKMIFGIYDLIQQNYFPNGSKILVVHTGGLQGIAGFNAMYGNLIKF